MLFSEIRDLWSVVTGGRFCKKGCSWLVVLSGSSEHFGRKTQVECIVVGCITVENTVENVQKNLQLLEKSTAAETTADESAVVRQAKHDRHDKKWQTSMTRKPLNCHRCIPCDTFLEKALLWWWWRQWKSNIPIKQFQLLPLSSSNSFPFSLCTSPKHCF
jgi:hypothetical protein